MSKGLFARNIADLRQENLDDYHHNREMILDFYEGRGTLPKYLKDVAGFKDVDMPLMGVKLFEKIIKKISLLYKYAPDRDLGMDENPYQDLISDNPHFNQSRKTAERYKNALHSILYMPIYTKRGWQFPIFTEWIPHFLETDSFHPIAYSIPLAPDVTKTNDVEEEQTWLFVSEYEWFLHDADGGNVRPDPRFPAAADMTNPLGIMPVVEERRNTPVTSYLTEGEIELALANQTLNMAINDVLGLIHYKSFPETIVRGLDKESGQHLKTGFNKTHIFEDENTVMERLSAPSQITDSVEAIERIKKWVYVTFGVVLKLDSSGGQQSGFSLLVENIDLLEDREDSIDIAKIAERKIYQIMQKQTEIFDVRDSNGKKVKLPPLGGDVQLNVDFQEGIDFPVNQKDEIERIQFELATNQISYLDLIQRNNPDLDEDAAMEKLMKNREINENYLTNLQKAFRDQLNEVTNEQTQEQTEG